MGHRVGGTYYATGEKMWICIGFVPDWIRIIGNQGATADTIEWDRTAQGSLLSSEGLLRITGGTAVQDFAVGEGIQTYHGGETLVSGTGTLGVGTTTYAHTANVYLTWDDGGDYRFLPGNKANGLGDATDQDIDKWTMDSGGATGYFNDDVLGNYIGEGSPIVIDGKRYSITILTATQGEATTEVTLSHQYVPDGEVQYIGGKVSLKSYIAGEVTKAGFTVASGITTNVTTELCSFEAGTFDI